MGLDAAPNSQDWIPADQLLDAASKELSVGQLIHASSFNLYEAMSAVEVGNVKMDLGAQPQANALQDYQLETKLSDSQLIRLMDHLLCLEASWHKGSSLAQTVYCSHYMMQQHRLPGSGPLAAYCKIVEALCLEFNQLVIQGCVCEEEDFNVHTAGLPLEAPAGTATTMNGSANSSKGSSSSSTTTTGQRTDKVLAAVSLAVDQLGGPHQQSSAAAAALVARLQFHKLLVQAVQRLRRRTKADLDQGAKLLLKALTELGTIRASRDLAAGEVLGFDATLNSHLVPPVPPRFVEMQDMDQALTHFEALVRQLIKACSITSVSDYYGLKEFLEAFSNSLPHALARSALHLQLLIPTPHDPKASKADVPAWAPGESMLKALLHIEGAADLGTDVGLFLEQALIAVGNFCQAMLLNRCRQRRRLRRCLDDWGNLYHHAVNADMSDPFQQYLVKGGWTWSPEHPEEQQGPLGTWVEQETCSTMMWHLLLGFELELYEPREFTMLFWYLDYLASISLQDVKQIQQALPKGPAKPGTGGDAKGGKKVKPKAAASSAAAAAARSSMQVQQAATVVEVHKAMSLGMMRLMLALSLSSMCPQSELPFNSEMQRFDQRFASFHLLTRPDPLGYDQFLASTATVGLTAEQLYSVAAEAFNRARQACALFKVHSSTWRTREELQEDMAKLERVAGANAVAVGLLLRAGGRNMSVRFEQLHHRWFPAVSLKAGGPAAAAAGAGAGGKAI